MGALLGGWDPQRVGCCPFRAVSLLCEGCFVCERKQNHFLSKKNPGFCSVLDQQRCWCL